VPLCIIARTFAEIDKESDNFGGLNRALVLFLYLPYWFVFVFNFIGLVYIWKRFSQKDGKGGPSTSVRLRVLRTIKQYLAVQFFYSFLVLSTYFAGWYIHTCGADSTFVEWQKEANEKNVENILAFPPPCASWSGQPCNLQTATNDSLKTFSVVMQHAFMVLFCLRGLPDLLVFLYLNKSRIIERIRDREFNHRGTHRSGSSSKSTSSWSVPLVAPNDEDFRGVQSLNIAHNFREEIMAYTQVHSLTAMFQTSFLYVRHLLLGKYIHVSTIVLNSSHSHSIFVTGGYQMCRL
jgi:hypothetical protein